MSQNPGSKRNKSGSETQFFLANNSFSVPLTFSAVASFLAFFLAAFLAFFFSFLATASSSSSLLLELEDELEDSAFLACSAKMSAFRWLYRILFLKNHVKFYSYQL